jgi:hypothetical protein
MKTTNIMGKAYSLPCYAIDISEISELKVQLEVLRTSGEWEEQEVCQDPTKYEAAYGDNPARAVPAATSILYSKKAGSQATCWRIFMNKHAHDHPEAVCGWRSLEKIRPLGVSEEDAKEWRKKVETEILKLYQEGRNTYANN